MSVQGGKSLLVPTPRPRTGLLSEIQLPEDCSEEIYSKYSTRQVEITTATTTSSTTTTTRLVFLETYYRHQRRLKMKTKTPGTAATSSITVTTAIVGS